MTISNGYSATTVESWLQQMADTLRSLTIDAGIDPLILGIKTGGVAVARRLHEALQPAAPCGELNISFYRDDFSRLGLHPQVGASDIPFSIDGRTVILVDDVLYSGRTSERQ